MSNFNIIRVSANLCRFSPNGDKFAYCVGNKLAVRHTRTFDQCHTFSCVDVIQISVKLEFAGQMFEKYSDMKFHENLSSGSHIVPCRQTGRMKLTPTSRNVEVSKNLMNIGWTQINVHIEWSPDSQYILCAFYQYSTIQVFSLQNHDWKCKLKDTVSGIVEAWWSPDSRHILTCAEFRVSICIWSLVSQSVKYIKGLKETTSPSLSFSADGRWLAVVGQQGAVDCIYIFSTSWDLKKQIPCVGLSRVEGFSWTVDCSSVCVWEGSQGRCHLQVYGAATGELVGKFDFSPGGVMSGIKTMAWSRSGQFLALSCFDDKIRLLNHITWQSVVEFAHCDVILDNDCTVHQESLARGESSKVSFELVRGRPVIISSLQLDPDKCTELLGIGLAVFSSCGYFLATRVDKMPAAIWIWSIKETRLHAVIVHKQPVTAISWAPGEPRLAIVSGSNFVSLWISKEVTVHMSDHICVSDVRWQPSGECLALYAGTKVVFLTLSVF